MGTVYNIRGTNGAGKTTLARAFLGVPVDLNWFPSPTKKDPARQLRVEGYWKPGVAVVGRYGPACGGLDTVSAGFAVQQGALSYALDKWTSGVNVIAEGVLASTVYGSWATFDLQLEAAGHRFAWCYLDTPLEVCYEHIRKRQEAAGNAGKVIKGDLVADKHKAILATRRKALADGRLVYDIPYRISVGALTDIMNGDWEGYRAHR